MTLEQLLGGGRPGRAAAGGVRAREGAAGRAIAPDDRPLAEVRPRPNALPARCSAAPAVAAAAPPSARAASSS